MPFYLVVFLYLLSYPKEETFCSCKQSEPISMEEIGDNDIILHGLVQKIETIDYQKLVTFKIKKLYKGKMETATVIISTPTDQSMCGLNISTDSEWLLFASEREGRYSTNSCTRSANLDSNVPSIKERIEKDIAFLEQLEGSSD